MIRDIVFDYLLNEKNILFHLITQVCSVIQVNGICVEKKPIHVNMLIARSGECVFFYAHTVLIYTNPQISVFYHHYMSICF